MRLTRAIMSGCAEQDAAPRLQASRWGWKARETRMLVYLLIVHPRSAQYRRARKSKSLSVLRLHFEVVSGREPGGVGLDKQR